MPTGQKRKAPAEFSPRITRHTEATSSAASTPRKAGAARIGVPANEPGASTSAAPNEAGQDDIDLDESEEEPEATSSDSALASLPIDTLQKHLPAAQSRVMSVLAGVLPPPGATEGEECIGLAKQWSELRGTLSSTTSNKEGNSTLLIGARGVGKSLLLDSVLRSISDGPSFFHVHLDAALQTTDGAAMKELARQLVKVGAITMPEDATKAMEEPVDSDAEEEEEGEDQDEEEEVDEENEAAKKKALEGAVLSSIAATTSTILTLLSTTGTSSKPLLISLANFDLFTSRPRQALLYVLLDAVQAGSYTPGLGVIGLTSRLDTTDLFEKRVRSRFSGRTLNLYAPNREKWEEIAREALGQGAKVEEEDEDAQAFTEAWKKDVEQLFEDQKFQHLLQDQHDLSADVRSLYRIMTVPISNLTATSPSFPSRLFTHSALTQRNSTLDSQLSELTTSEFALLIAAKHLQTRDRHVFNFEMCFYELQRWVGATQREMEGAGTGGIGLGVGAASKGIRESGALGDRRKAMMSFTTLLDLELFLPEAMLATIAHLPGPQAGAASLSKTARGAVRPGYLRVRCAIDGPIIARAAKSRGRREALGTALVQWANSAGS